MKHGNRLPGEIAKGWTLRILGPWKQEEGGGGIFFRNKLLNLISKGNNKIDLCNPIFDRTELKEDDKGKYFIYPSQAVLGETFGLSVLEAMSCGCVPIVSFPALLSRFYKIRNRRNYFGYKSFESSSGN